MSTTMSEIRQQIEQTMEFALGFLCPRRALDLESIDASSWLEQREISNTATRPARTLRVAPSQFPWLLTAMGRTEHFPSSLGRRLDTIQKMSARRHLSGYVSLVVLITIARAAG